MTRPVLVPFRAEHLLGFLDRDTGIRQELRFAMEKERRGPAFTATVDGRVIGCAGVMILWPGVGMAWVVLADEAAAYRIWLTRTVRAILSDIIRSLGLHRVEAVVLADSPRNLRWIRALGFRPENDIAQAYTHDQRDVVRFERVMGGMA